MTKSLWKFYFQHVLRYLFFITSHLLDAKGQSKVVLYPAQTWNSNNCPRLFR